MTPTVYSNNMNRVREDEWPIQLPALPYSPAPTLQRSSDAPVYPHPQSGMGSQLPPIRNLVPNLWEPGTSKSSQQISTDEGQDGSLVHPLRPVAPTWSGGLMDANDRHTPRLQLEMSHHESESKQDASRQANESNKRPPSSPIERADHARTTLSSGIINPNRRTISNAQKPSQTSKQTGEKSDVRSRSNSEATKPSSECLGSGPQPSHQQGILRDPVGKLWVRLIYR
ncbi:hypothetical protein BDM02DRAFT_3187611 [Thelephora ganbajun]|uniref:Uncharacterized protein n=1 Tax=Thelephora ganbajun TaxID=370292 RepID=A0ACB6ZDS0_THEGA|nr:hypothetical protein BDM02DRAFT_3187611 [Thelephora ganbajun]